MPIKNIEIGYNTPVKLTQRLGLEGLRIYLSGMNLLTLTKVENYDPEANDTWGAYPPQKIYNVGLQLTF
jgi:hypothetical protein